MAELARRPRFTLGHVFLAAIAGVALLLGVLFYLIHDASRRSIAEGADGTHVATGK